MPTTSWRGTMMSFTVTFSRSRMESSIVWWRWGIKVPASWTTVRSSSRVEVVALAIDSRCDADQPQ